LNSTHPCHTINFTLARSVEILDVSSITIYLTGNITNQNVEFEDNSRVLQSVVIQAEDNSTRGGIIHSNISIVAPVELSEFDIQDSVLFSTQIKLHLATVYRSAIHGLLMPQGLATSSLSVIDSSRFVDTQGIYHDVNISNSVFSNAPVRIIAIQSCYIRNSLFQNTTAEPAVEVNICTIEMCEFSNNTAPRGAALYVHNNTQLFNSTLHNNMAYEGGAIYAFGQISLHYTEVRHNEATVGGGLYLTANTSGSLMCSNTIVSSNKASHGGGIAIIAHGQYQIAAGCEVLANAAVFGGGLYIEGSMVSENIWQFAGNTADNNGGAIYLNASDAEFNGKFTSDNAVEGAAIYAKDSALTISHAEFIPIPGSNASIVALHNSSSRISMWHEVSFMNLELHEGLYCDDCASLLCSAHTNCTDCPYGCLSFSSGHSVCTSSYNHTKFGCYGESTCDFVEQQSTRCSCPPGYHGNLCAERNPEENKPLPTWAVVVIAVGGAAILAIAIALIVRAYRKRQYEPISTH
jgi:predicted outer membrane repeat protein